MRDKLPDIFHYIDYRHYLDDYRIQRRAIDPGFTHAYICHKLGSPNSRSYLNNIIKGRKTLSASFIDRMSELLEHTPSQSKYFRALVYYNQTMVPNEKEFYFNQVIQLNETPQKLINKNEYAFYSESYHTTMHALLEIYDFKDDYREIAKKIKPQITPALAKKSIQLLLELGLITTNEQGYLKPTNKILSTGENIKDHIIRYYQLKCLELGKEALIANDNEPCKTSTLTLSVSSSGLEQIHSRLQQFKNELRSIVHQDTENAQKVYQINLQIFTKSN